MSTQSLPTKDQLASAFNIIASALEKGQAKGATNLKEAADVVAALAILIKHIESLGKEPISSKTEKPS